MSPATLRTHFVALSCTLVLTVGGAAHGEERPVVPAQPPPARPADQTGAIRTAAWATLAATVALSATGAVFLLGSKARADEIAGYELTIATSTNPANNPPQVLIDHARAEQATYDAAAIGVFAAAGASAIASAALLVVTVVRRSPEAPRVSVVPAPVRGGAGVMATFAF